jgi:two-component system CheB/CheR fusion protein
MSDTPALSVLVVDDERDTADSMAMLLQAWGHTPQVAYDGLDALALAERSRPDVALLDMGLPGLDGWALARRLYEVSAERRPLLVAITGFGQQADVCRSRTSGIDLHLVKPVEPSALFALLERFRQVLFPPFTMPNAEGGWVPN